MERSTHSSDKSSIAVVDHGSGRDLLQKGKWEEARAAFESDLRNNPSPDALKGLGDALWWLGEIDASISYLRRAYAAYLRQTNTFSAAQAALTLSITYKACLGNDPVASGWLARAERAVSQDELAMLQGYFWFMRAYLRIDHDPQGAMGLLRQALDHARSSGDPDLELCALGGLGAALVKVGSVEQGLQLVDEAMAGVSGGEYTRLDTVVTVNCIMINACETSHDWDRVAKWRPVADDFVDAYGCPYVYADCRALHAGMLVATGQWPEAEQELKTALRMTEGVYPSVYAGALSLLGDLRLRQGRIDEAEALLKDIDHTIEATIPLAAVKLARRQHAVAKALLQRCLRHHGQDSLASVRALEMLVEAHIASDDLKAAAASLARLKSSASCGASPEAAARESMAAGRVAASRGDIEAATGCFEKATAVFRRLGLPFEAALGRLAIAQSTSTANPELAIVEAQGALSAFEALGATGHVDMTGALLRALGIAAKPGPKGIGLLTKREHEILHLISSGLSNPEIAQRLFISRKTASHHVSSILSKLALRNRAEVVAYVTRVDQGAHAKGASDS